MEETRGTPPPSAVPFSRRGSVAPPPSPLPGGEGELVASSKKLVARKLETRASSPSPPDSAHQAEKGLGGGATEPRRLNGTALGGGTKRLAVLLSGRGSNMLALADAAASGPLRGVAEVAVVFSNDPDAPGLAAAAARGLPTASLPSAGRKRAAFDADVVALLQGYRPDYVVLAGYMRVLSPGFVQAFAGRIVNIHPADTRQHRGLHAYEWAWEQRLPETTITVHLVDEGLDTGPILAQQVVNLEGATSLAEVQRRGLAVEHRLYPETLAALLKRNAEPAKRSATPFPLNESP